MTTFDLYAAYYDLLYRDKDYAGESDYVTGLLHRFAPGASTVLEFGCGTGGHAVRLAEQGWHVHGVDLSERMIDIARAKRDVVATDVQSRLSFETSDIRTFRAGRTFDAVISLFHVMSYQTGDADQDAAVAAARAHLNHGGLFVFDFWHGPAVLADRPRHVVREVSDGRVQVHRTTTPTMDLNANRVDVRFDVRITAKADGRMHTMSEFHRMRYLFLPEIEGRLAAHGFEAVAAHKWLTHRDLDEQSWYGCVVGKAI